MIWVGIMGAEGDSSEPKVGGEGGELINIRCSNGSKFSVRACLDIDVGAFKAILAQNCDIPADQQRLIYKGRILKDDQTLISYGKFFIAIFFVDFYRIWVDCDLDFCYFC